MSTPNQKEGREGKGREGKGREKRKKKSRDTAAHLKLGLAKVHNLSHAKYNDSQQHLATHNEAFGILVGNTVGLVGTRVRVFEYGTVDFFKRDDCHVVTYKKGK